MGAVIGGLAVGIVSFVISYIYIGSLKTTLPKEQTAVPTKAPDQYEVIFAQTTTLPDKEEEVLVKGLVGKNEEASSSSYLGIYQKQPGGGWEELYKYLPVIPESVQYPRPLVLEKIWLPKPGVIVSSWGETGADYFGTHPIVLTYKDGKFGVTSFYKGDISQDSRVKKSTWTQKDFEVTNYFEKTETAKTILTQGVSVEAGQIVLSFFSDSNCHACEHKIVRLKFPL